MVLVRLDNNTVLWMGRRPTNQDFYTIPLLLFSHVPFPMCPFVQQGENPDIFIQYHTVKEIDSVD
jgi:hypothetical protein